MHIVAKIAIALGATAILVVIGVKYWIRSISAWDRIAEQNKEISFDAEPYEVTELHSDYLRLRAYQKEIGEMEQDIRTRAGIPENRVGVERAHITTYFHRPCLNVRYPKTPEESYVIGEDKFVAYDGAQLRRLDPIPESHMLNPELIVSMPAQMDDLYKMFHVPQPIYQVWFEKAFGPDKDKIRAEIFEELKDYVKHTYPGYGIIGFEDYCREEALDMRRKTGYPFEWGMWVMLQAGADSVMGDLSGSLELMARAIQDRKSEDGTIYGPSSKSNPELL
jgi:hypothetical protein